jgi:hypothetical protein
VFATQPSNGWVAQNHEKEAVMGGPNQGADAAAGAAMICMFVLYFAIIAVLVISMWKIFVKAGKPGWAALIPFYNMYVLVEIVEKPIFYFILLFVPCVNIVISIMIYVALAEKFGYGAGFAVGLILLPFIFFPILGFGSAQYQGTSALRRRRDYDEDDYDDRRRR